MAQEPADDEFKALTQTSKSLVTCSPEARRRILVYLVDRFLPTHRLLESPPISGAGKNPG